MNRKTNLKTWGVMVVVVVCVFALPALGQYGGGSGTAGDPYLIYTPAQMNTIGASLLDWDKHFKLMANINLGGFTGTSFFIIGSSSFPFTGVFDGNGHTISNFTYTSTGTDYIGLFGYVLGQIKDLGLINPNVDAGTGGYVGSLVGWLQNGTITGCYVEGGSVSGTSTIFGVGNFGGLVGRNVSGAITNCYAEAVSVPGYLNVGGLVGKNSGTGTISNCYSTGTVSGNWYVGGLVGGNYGTITNCNSSCDVSGGDLGAGGLVGRNGGTISNCYSTGSVSGVIYVGGLVGANLGTIFNCYSSASVSASGGGSVFDTGGLVGLNLGGEIYNCYATGSVSGDLTVGGLVGRNVSGAITNCYSTGSVSGTTDVGGLVGSGSTVTVVNSFWDTQTSGQSTSAGGTGLTTAQMQTMSTFTDAGWEFIDGPGPSDDWADPVGGGYMILWWQLPENELPPLPTFSGGTGEANDPYLISTTTDLNRIGHNGRLMAAHFRLINDIDLAGVDFFLVGSRGYGYSGVFDANGHTISNFTYNSTGTNNLGVFGGVAGEDAEIKDLGLINPNVDAGTGDYVGSLVGWLQNGTITGCYVDGGSVSGTGTIGGGNFGGLVGRNVSGAITNCYAEAVSVSGSSSVGGLVGTNQGAINDCHSSVAVSGYGSVGGLVGFNSGLNFRAEITGCNSSGSVSGISRVGGLVGVHELGTITNCYSSASVSASGGDSVFDTGGLVGLNSGGEIYNCYATGSVSGVNKVGGLVGTNRSSVSRSEGTITNCYSTGSVSGTTTVGGLVGWNVYHVIYGIGNITNCYSVGGVSGTLYVGGLVGTNDGEVGSSFWDVNTSGRTNMCGSQGAEGSGCDDSNGLPTAQMQTESTFTSAGWDFVDIWEICEGTNYARFIWQILVGDLVCPDGVDWNDVAVLCEQWLLEELSWDVWPNDGDGIVNFFDWGVFAGDWKITNDIAQLSDFAEQWLQTGVNYYIADIAPPPDGDGIVDFRDFAAQAANWLAGK